MKFSFTKNPNHLQCPVCCELVRFARIRNITCSNCRTQLDVDSKSAKLQAACWGLFCTPAIFLLVPQAPEKHKWIGSIVLWVISCVLLGIGNAEAKLIQRR